MKYASILLVFFGGVGILAAPQGLRGNILDDDYDALCGEVLPTVAVGCQQPGGCDLPPTDPPCDSGGCDGGCDQGCDVTTEAPCDMGCGDCGGGCDEQPTPEPEPMCDQ